MKPYIPEKLVAISRYKALFSTLPSDIQQDVYAWIQLTRGCAQPTITSDNHTIGPTEILVSGNILQLKDYSKTD